MMVMKETAIATHLFTYSVQTRQEIFLKTFFKIGASLKEE